MKYIQISMIEPDYKSEDDLNVKAIQLLLIRYYYYNSL